MGSVGSTRSSSCNAMISHFVEKAGFATPLVVPDANDAHFVSDVKEGEQNRPRVSTNSCCLFSVSNATSVYSTGNVELEP